MIDDQVLIASLIEENEKLKSQLKKHELASELVPYHRLSIYEDLTYKKIFPSYLKFLKKENIEDVNLKVGENDRDVFLKDYAIRFFIGQENKNSEIVSMEIDGQVKKILIYSAKVATEKMAIFLFTDISEPCRKHMKKNERNQKLETLGEQFLSIVHDVINPLSMVEYSAFTIAKKIDNEEIHQKLKELRHSNSIALSIIKNVKSYANLIEDKIIREDTQLIEILNEAIDHTHRKMDLLKIQYSIDEEFKKYIVNCNRTEMYQVFVNLISNAIDAIKDYDDKWIKIKLEKYEDERVIIHVIDSGNGIPLEKSLKIFEAFFTTKKKNGGMGLGLSIVRDRVHRNGGEIGILDKAENTTFEVLIPARII